MSNYEQILDVTNIIQVNYNVEGRHYTDFNIYFETYDENWDKTIVSKTITLHPKDCKDNKIPNLIKVTKRKINKT
tara:strand:+ start:271 stop:495 length:225 start_codon:yes stop_codon:yes gene_type:complete